MHSLFSDVPCLHLHEKYLNVLKLSVKMQFIINNLAGNTETKAWFFSDSKNFANGQTHAKAWWASAPHPV